MNTKTEAAIEAIAQALYKDRFPTLEWQVAGWVHYSYYQQAKIALRAAKDAGMVFKVEVDLTDKTPCKRDDFCAYEEIEL